MFLDKSFFLSHLELDVACGRDELAVELGLIDTLQVHDIRPATPHASRCTISHGACVESEADTSIEI